MKAANLKEVLSYDPATGELRWLERPDNPAFNGLRAGKLALNCADRLGYRVGRLFGRMVKAHRVAFALMMGRWPEGDIDHINGDPSDNRWCNLRECTHAENQRNARPRQGRLKGVTLKPSGNWLARITVGGRHHALGTYPTEREAALAYDAAAIRLHGRFARINFPDIRNRPHMALKTSFDAVEGGPDARPAVCASFHSPTDTQEGQHDHA